MVVGQVFRCYMQMRVYRICVKRCCVRVVDGGAKACGTDADQAPRRWLATNAAVASPTIAWAQPSAGRTVSGAK